MTRMNRGMLVVCAWMGFAALGHGEIIYRETFDNSMGQTALSYFGWYAYYGNSATNAALCSPGAGGDPATAMSSGGPSAKESDGTYASDTNAGSSGPYPSVSGGYAPNERGFVTTPCMYGLYDIFIYTTEYAIDTSVYQLESFSFYATSTGTWTSDARDAVHVGVQIGDSWYVTDVSITPPSQTNGGGTTFTNEAIAFSLAADTYWSLLNFEAGSPLTVDDLQTASLPAGTITGFGLLWDMAATSDRNTPRWDTFSITATTIPEPTCLLLLACGGLLMRRTGGRR